MIEYGQWYYYNRSPKHAGSSFYVIIFEGGDQQTFCWRKNVDGELKFGKDVGGRSQWSLSDKDKCEQPELSVGEKRSIIRNIFEDLYK